MKDGFHLLLKENNTYMQWKNEIHKQAYFKIDLFRSDKNEEIDKR